MDAGTCNANIQFENYAYNMSGVTTEQSKTSLIQIKNKLNCFEFCNENYDDIDLQDIEIIAIDPNNYYSETTSSSGSSSESDEDGEQQEVANVSANAYSFNAIPFKMPPSTDDFDIITLNIDEEFPIDPEVDEILFQKDHQFDLASYIGGESTSLLLSPMNDASARRRMISTSDCRHFDSNEMMVINDVTQINNITRDVAQTNAAHDKVAKTPACNRRKRKNLSREFIETSDSDDDDDDNGKKERTCKIKSSINHVIDDNKRKPCKNDDPVWSPTVDKHGTIVLKPQVKQHNIKQTVDYKVSIESKEATKTSQQFQGKGLRNMLKQQFLSDRPMNKGKFLKTLSMPSASLDQAIRPKVVPYPVKRMGIGRGKDIQITAKYYNCNEPSESSECDKNSKQDRFHQIITDSNTDTELESESETEDSDIEVNSEPIPTPKDICKTKQEQVININKDKQRVNYFENKPSVVGEQQVKKITGNKTNSKPPISKPIVIDNISMDSTAFAKALVTNAKKAVVKSKPPVSNKSHLEQQKRIIQSNILLQNPAKFKVFTSEKCKSSSNGVVTSSTAVKTIPPNVMAERKPELIKFMQKCPTKGACSDKPIVKKVEDERKKTDQLEESKQIDQVKASNKIDNVKESIVVHEIQENQARDNHNIEESKVELSAKRKLNIHEYLQRKSLKTLYSDRIAITNIKIEPTENETKNNENQNNKNSKDDELSNGYLAGNSLYEEIIIVSMGCNTEASFMQPNVLLSDIQTSVEKANSKISSMSLISSIQDVILKKTHNIEQNVSYADASYKKEEDEKPEHGENKVIMHLRKDRVRPTCVTTSVQTDPYFQFPPLEKLAPLSKKQSTLSEKRIDISRQNESHFMHADNNKRRHRNYREPSRLSESSYYSDEDNKTVQRRSRHSDFIEHNTVRHRRQRRESSHYSSSKNDRYLRRRRTISRSLSSSSDTSTTSTELSSSSQSSSSSRTYVSSASTRSLNSYGGSSSKSYYGDDYQYYRKRTTSNNSRRSNYRKMSGKRSNSTEERRIVYVGRIEHDTTKEDLHRKFSVYGPVRQVSIHYKESKLEYGFVTFARPCDAYTAIDDSSKNPTICHYDVSFGGRRAFCREKYFDLDNTGYGYRNDGTSPQKQLSKESEDSFEALLRKVKEKLKK